MNSIQNLEGSALIDFYRGEPITQTGSGAQYTIDEIIALSDDAWEVFHDFIQWIYPLKEASNFNCDAPILTDEDIKLFRADPQLKGKFYDAMIRGFRFFGLEENVIAAGGVGPWCNWLRATRFITCMRLMGFDRWAETFFKKLDEEPIKTISENSWNYWYEATYREL